jgi:hypothetical protein
VEPLPTPIERISPASQAEIIVLDDLPMLLDEGAVLVEDEGTVASVAEGWAEEEDDVIEVGDEVLFDA